MHAAILERMSANLLGIGLYSIEDVSRLVRVPSRDVRRWMFGYHYRRGNERVEMPPVAGSQLRVGERDALTFFELLELRLIRELRRHEVSLQTIRVAVERAKTLAEHPHPFVIRRISTDGRRIFAEAAKESGDRELLDLVGSQYAIAKVIEDSLIAGVVFGDDGVAKAWHPNPDDASIILDPSRSFGRPILDEYAIPTWVLYEAYKAESGDIHAVSAAYDVPVELVTSAVLFESGMAGQVH